MDSLFLNRRIAQFLAVYETQNIHRASERLGITQPALTVSLKNLEDELGQPLFERSVKGMAPLPAADALYRFGTALRQGGRLASDEMRMQRGDAGGTLRIGAGVAWAATLLPGTLREMHRQFPDLSFDLISGVGDQLAARLADGELDVVVAAGSIARLLSDGFEQQHVVNLPMKVVADPASPLGQKRCISAADMVSTPWVGFYEDDIIVQQSRHFMALRGLPPPRFVMRSNSPATLTAFIKGSDFISVLIGPLVAPAIEAGLVELELEDPLWELPVNLYNRAFAESYSPLKAFKALCVERIRAFDPAPR
ncbi:LysR family transcriptional regulator [Sulfitobacter sp. D35]|uniref:LysR family transcriptional regulator n=1 Tax=Sulfitobacter sp. D35 TaxID=3083252 RepID=UPI00296E4642|nr:LysR family transcriptional regulator [Sulfitobacter sp. D35]MDW4499349.1 LysR family transcriptional regulator [Sulfitobacter sp. D35]